MTDQASTLLLTTARLADGRSVDVVVTDGTIRAVTPVGEQTPRDGWAVLDCAGALLVPSFVEGHIHLDKTLLGLPLIPHRPGRTVADRIRNEKELRATLDLSIEQRGGAPRRAGRGLRDRRVANACRHRYGRRPVPGSKRCSG